MPKKKKKSGPPKYKGKMKKRAPTLNSKQLTLHLRELAAEIETIDDEGRTITRGEALARMLWKKALGYTEIGSDKVEIYVKPASWAIQLIYDRMEGKAPIAIPDDKGRLTTAGKVSELARARINSMSDAIAAVSDQKGPVDLPDNGAEGSKGPNKESDMASETSRSG